MGAQITEKIQIAERAYANARFEGYRLPLRFRIAGWPEVRVKVESPVKLHLRPARARFVFVVTSIDAICLQLLRSCRERRSVSDMAFTAKRAVRSLKRGFRNQKINVLAMT